MYEKLNLKQTVSKLPFSSVGLIMKPIVYHENTCISGYDDKVLHGVVSLSECWDNCQAWSECKVVEFFKTGSMCFLSQVEYDNIPESAINHNCDSVYNFGEVLAFV